MVVTYLGIPNGGVKMGNKSHRLYTCICFPHHPGFSDTCQVHLPIHDSIITINFRLERRSVWHPCVPWMDDWLEEGIDCICIPPLLLSWSYQPPLTPHCSTLLNTIGIVSSAPPPPQNLLLPLGTSLPKLNLPPPQMSAYRQNPSPLPLGTPPGYNITPQ